MSKHKTKALEKKQKKKGRPFAGAVQDNKNEKFVKEKRSIFRSFATFYRLRCYEGKPVAEEDVIIFQNRKGRLKIEEQDRFFRSA